MDCLCCSDGGRGPTSDTEFLGSVCNLDNGEAKFPAEAGRYVMVREIVMTDTVSRTISHQHIYITICVRCQQVCCRRLSICCEALECPLVLRNTHHIEH